MARWKRIVDKGDNAYILETSVHALGGDFEKVECRWPI
jgi:hypothetical protein